MADKKYRSIDEVMHEERPLRGILDNHKEFVRCRITEGFHGVSGFRAQLHKADLSNLRALQREDQDKKEILFPVRIDDYLFDKWDHPRKADVIAKVVGDFCG